MRLFDLFGRSRPRCAPRPRINRVRCTVELLESRLLLSGTDSTQPPVLPPPLSPPTLAAPPVAGTTTGWGGS